MKHIPVPVGCKTGDAYTHPTLGPGRLVAVGGAIIHSQAGAPMFLSAIFAPDMPIAEVREEEERITEELEAMKPLPGSAPHTWARVADATDRD